LRELVVEKFFRGDELVSQYLILLISMLVWLCDARAEALKIAIPSTTQAVLPFTIARDKGYYRAEGLNVELILISAPIASRALLSGDVAVATVGGAGLPPVLRGSPFKFLFTTYNRAMFWLYGKPEIRDVKGLKSKRVGVSGIGSGPDSLLREILRQNGLDANRDVTVLSLGVMPTIFSGLQSGIVDAAMLSPPVTFKADEAGFRELVSEARSRRAAGQRPRQRRFAAVGWVADGKIPSGHLYKDFFTSKTIARERFHSSHAICT
jgi:ABC-type nitrate/sulfonate/bicarbonate transport system substrate-binding protein